MQYEVISRFFDKDRGVYVDPGTPCPRLSRRAVERLLRARCIAPAEKGAAPTEPKGGRGKAPVEPPPADPTPQPPPPPAGE